MHGCQCMCVHINKLQTTSIHLNVSRNVCVPACMRACVRTCVYFYTNALACVSSCTTHAVFRH